MDVLVTAGATRNPVDAMRYLSAGSSGRTGVEIARAFGPRAHLLGSAEACLRADDLSTEEFGSTRDLMARVEANLRAFPRVVLVHAAAVGDYEAEAAATKIPSGLPELVLRLRPTPKIVDHVRDWAPDCRLVSFKAASPDATDVDGIARAQLHRTRSDLVFANVLGDLDRSSRLVTATGVQRFVFRTDAIAALVDQIRAWLA